MAYCSNDILLFITQCDHNSRHIKWCSPHSSHRWCSTALSYHEFTLATKEGWWHWRGNATLHAAPRSCSKWSAKRGTKTRTVKLWIVALLCELSLMTHSGHQQLLCWSCEHNLAPAATKLLTVIAQLTWKNWICYEAFERPSICESFFFESKTWLCGCHAMARHVAGQWP